MRISDGQFAYLNANPTNSVNSWEGRLGVKCVGLSEREGERKSEDFHKAPGGASLAWGQGLKLQREGKEEATHSEQH